MCRYHRQSLSSEHAARPHTRQHRRRLRLKEMHRIVNALPREYKIPFSMHVSGFKYREIAEKLNLPLGTVKSRIFFTRQKLQQELKDFR
ncbi:ECF-type sigma factor [Bacteroides uniformis]|nr:ECF-type sigma factor [Bacteroides uniformis]